MKNELLFIASIKARVILDFLYPFKNNSTCVDLVSFQKLK